MKYLLTASHRSVILELPVGGFVLPTTTMKLITTIRKSGKSYTQLVPSSYDEAKQLGKAYGKKRVDGTKYMCSTEWRKRWRKAHREACRAHLQVHRALKKGILVKAPCFCGELKVEGHHHKGYGEHSLDVMWVCPLHHRQIHGLKAR